MKSIELLRSWNKFVRTEKQLSSVEKTKKARNLLCPANNPDVSRTGWAGLIWASKSLCNRYSIQTEGEPVDELIAKAIDINHVALDAMIVYLCCGVEVAEQIIIDKEAE